MLSHLQLCLPLASLPLGTHAVYPVSSQILSGAMVPCFPWIPLHVSHSPDHSLSLCQLWYSHSASLSPWFGQPLSLPFLWLAWAVAPGWLMEECVNVLEQRRELWSHIVLSDESPVTIGKGHSSMGNIALLLGFQSKWSDCWRWTWLRLQFFSKIMRK